ncbi:MAG: hypothetical protein H3C47_09960 [Candidatus Cloacimonetes bacterium]|nr:hypothetical protein [Candidatus Cloacimonadota bacterium]
MFIKQLAKKLDGSTFFRACLCFCFVLISESSQKIVVVPTGLVPVSGVFIDQDTRILSESLINKDSIQDCLGSPCLDLKRHPGSIWVNTDRRFDRDQLYGIRLKLFLEEDFSEGELAILYSSHYLPGLFSLHRFSVASLTKNQIVEVDVWLPELARPENAKWIFLFSPSTSFIESIPIEYRTEKFLNQPGVRFLGFEWLNPVKEKPAVVFDTGRAMWPSLMDQGYSLILLGTILFLFLARILILWKRRIGMKVQFCLILPTIGLIWGMFRSFDRTEIEKLEISGLEQELIQESDWWNSHRMTMDELFFQEIERFIRECKQNIDTISEAGFSLEDYRKFEKTPVYHQLIRDIFTQLGIPSHLYTQLSRNQHPMEYLLVGTYFTRDIRYTISNSDTTFCLDEGDCFLNRMLASLFQRSIRLEVARGSRGLSPAEAETNAGVYSDLRELVSKAIQDTRVLDGFMNNPAKLYSLFPSDSKYLASRGLNFWYWFEHKGQNWTILGEVRERNYIRAFFDHMRKRYPDRITNAWVQARLGMPNFPLENGVISEMSRQAALNQSVSVPTFSLIWENNHPVLYYRTRLDLFESYTLVLRRDASSVFVNAQTYGNRVYLWLLSLLCGLFLISVLITGRVEFSARQLLDGLIRIRKGELNFVIVSSGGDQFARLTDGFNSFIEKLGEKELIGLLLNSMAVSSLKSQKAQSIRQEASVLFLSTNKEQGDMEYLLNLLDETVHKHQGFLDKFTGSSFMVIFPGAELKTNALECARELKRTLQHKGYGIGVAWGEVITGHVGSEGRKDFTAIGSTVNLAARLQALASNHEGTRIFTLAEYSRDFGLCDSSIRVMEELKIRGFVQDVRVCEVLD